MKSNEEKIVGNKYQLRDFLCLGVLSRYWGEKKHKTLLTMVKEAKRSRKWKTCSAVSTKLFFKTKQITSKVFSISFWEWCLILLEAVLHRKLTSLAHRLSECTESVRGNGGGWLCFVFHDLCKVQKRGVCAGRCSGKKAR